MNVLDIVRCATPPLPWAEGEKIPWDEPAFSTRMLQEHLSQLHDGASRRAAVRIRTVSDHRNITFGNRFFEGFTPS